jgi:hypothetical protein
MSFREALKMRPLGILLRLLVVSALGLITFCALYFSFAAFGIGPFGRAVQLLQEEALEPRGAVFFEAFLETADKGKVLEIWIYWPLILLLESLVYVAWVKTRAVWHYVILALAPGVIAAWFAWPSLLLYVGGYALLLFSIVTASSRLRAAPG